MENIYAPYKGNHLGRVEPTPVKEEDVQKEIESALAASPIITAKEGKAENGDIVNIDFEGFLNGTPFEGGKGEHYDLTLGSHSFIPGFEDQLVGHQKGEDVEVNVTFPADYQAKALKGKPAIFKCHIHEVKSKKKAELNAEFAAKYGAKDIEAFKQAVRQSLEAKAKDKAINEYLEKIMKTLVEGSTLNLDPKVLKERTKQVKDYYLKQIAQYGLDLATYLKMTSKDEASFEKALKEEAIRGLKSEMVMDHIAKEEGFSVSQEELEKEFEFIAKYYQLEKDALKRLKTERIEDIKTNLIRRKVGDFLLANND